MRRTDAQRFAAELDDGQLFETAAGESFADLLAGFAATSRDVGGCTRHEFTDGSVIIECAYAWDIGITHSSEHCHCWPEANPGGWHAEDCPDFQVAIDDIAHYMTHGVREVIRARMPANATPRDWLDVALAIYPEITRECAEIAGVEVPE